MTAEESLKLLERYGVTLVVLVAVTFGIVVVAGVLYREWLHWRPRVEGWMNEWMASAEKTQETHREVAKSSLDLQRSNSITLQGCALTLNAVHERVKQFPEVACPLDEDAHQTEIRKLREQLRQQRKLSESRPVTIANPPPGNPEPKP